MNRPCKSPKSGAPVAGSALPVIMFVGPNQAALWSAARLLGGYESARLVDKLANALLRERCLTRRIRLMLEQLLDLLALENVGDPDRPEMGYFAVIDPADPAIEEICLLTDGLRSAIARSVALPSESGDRAWTGPRAA